MRSWRTPILLTCTLCVWRAADAMVGWLLRQPDMQEVRSINPVVGETNNGGLSDIRLRPITETDVVAALEHAASGSVAAEVGGAGRGTQALGWKGGIGTSSRRLPGSTTPILSACSSRPTTIEILSIRWRARRSELGRYAFQSALQTSSAAPTADEGRGSCMVIVATDAPLSSRDLERVAKRAALGIGRTGSFAGPGSGEYVLAFSTAESVRRRYQPHPSTMPVYTYSELGHDDLAPLFEATVEATEEAIVNSLFRATPVTYRGHPGRRAADRARRGRSREISFAPLGPNLRQRRHLSTRRVRAIQTHLTQPKQPITFDLPRPNAHTHNH